MTAECRKMEETSDQLQQKNERLNAQLERETARAEKAAAKVVNCAGTSCSLLFFSGVGRQDGSTLKSKQD